MSLSSGSRLGPYLIAAPIGAGGMGEVYRAQDSRLQRQVAIKTLPPAFAADPARLARFQREAQALAALNHPNIAAIYGLEESEGVTALVMELVEGPTLEQRIGEGPIPVAEATAIARQIGAALEAAHEKGIVHRDLKPANIKLTGEGQVKVLDFGLAKAMDVESSSSNPPANSPTLTLESTRVGAIMGTAAYMSPEQARGKTVDRRTDIWAFGVVFFEMLTGRSIFEGETVSDSLANVLRSEIDWKLLPGDTPPAIRRLLERCLQRDPKRRLRDIGDAWIEVDSPLEVAAPVATPAPAPRSSRWPWIACGAAALVAMAAVAFAIFHKPALTPQPVVRWSYLPATPLVGLSLSHDGTRLAFMEVKGNYPRLAVRQMDQLEARPITEVDGGAFPVFSPDGQWIAFITPLAPSKVEKMPFGGGPPITICDYSGRGRGLAWGDDDNLVFEGKNGLVRVSSSGGTPTPITTVDSAKHESAHGWPFVLPGSHAILFTIQNGAGFQVAVVDLAKHSTRILAQNGTNPRYAASGHLLYYRSGAVFAAPFDLGRLEITGPESPVLEHVAGIDNGGADYTLSDNGLLAFQASRDAVGGQTVLNWADRKGTLEPLSEPKSWGTGRLSPDMTRVANGIYAGDNEDIWTYDLVRRTPLRLTFAGRNSFPIWSHDGRWITYVHIQDGKAGLYRVPADASGKPELLVETDPSAKPNSWTPDGKTLVFTQSSEGKPARLWSVAVPGGKPDRLHDTDTAEGNGEVSPDGHWLAYQSAETGSTDEIYVQPFPGPGAKTRISTNGGRQPRWAYSGKELFYLSQNSGQVLGVEVRTGTAFQAGVPQSLFSLPAGTTWDIAADGKRFLMETPEGGESGRHVVVAVNWFTELNRLASGNK